MGQYAGNNAWQNDVYEYDITDAVIGGPNGTANKPLHDLADRTAWLKAKLGLIQNVEDEVILTTSGPIGANLTGNLIVAFATNANILLSLADPHTFKHGAILPFTAYSNPGFVVSVFSGGFPITNPVDGVVSTMHMHHNEQLLLVALTDHWKVMNASGNFYCAGEEVKSRKVLLNTLAFKGQEISRAAYPRLWAYAQSLTMFQEIIDEASWWNNGLNYRGLFSTGNGTTTFRLPDERGMHDRMLDLGRGVDLSRTHNFPGGYEADQIKAHTHTTDIPSRDFSNSGTAGPDLTGNDGGAAAGSKRTFISSSVGGPEGTVKNLGKYNVVKF